MSRLIKVGTKTIIDLEQLVYVQDGNVDDNIPGRIVKKGIYVGLTGGHSIFLEGITTEEFCEEFRISVCLMPPKDPPQEENK